MNTKIFIRTGLATFLAVMFLGVDVAYAATTYDFGDAPDTFATARVSRVDQIWLGKGVDQEEAANLIDKDKFDDGLVVTSAKKVIASVVVRVAEPAGAVKGLAYINLLFDWNGNGKFDDQVGGPNGQNEWLVKNLEINLAEQEEVEKIYDFNIAVPGGDFSVDKLKPLWARAILTLDEKMASVGGGGSFASGEVEDYKLLWGPGERYKVKCSPAVLKVNHGEAGEFRISGTWFGPKPSESSLANSVAPNNDVRTINQIGPFTFSFQSLKVDGPKRVEPNQEPVEIKVRFRNSRGDLVASVTETCFASVYHKDLPPAQKNYLAKCEPDPLKMRHGATMSIKVVKGNKNSEEVSDIKVGLKDGDVVNQNHSIVRTSPYTISVSSLLKHRAPPENVQIPVKVFFGASKKVSKTIYCHAKILHEDLITKTEPPKFTELAKKSAPSVKSEPATLPLKLPKVTTPEEAVDGGFSVQPAMDGDTDLFFSLSNVGQVAISGFRFPFGKYGLSLDLFMEEMLGGLNWQCKPLAGNKSKQCSGSDKWLPGEKKDFAFRLFGAPNIPATLSLLFLDVSGQPIGQEASLKKM